MRTTKNHKSRNWKPEIKTEIVTLELPKDLVDLASGISIQSAFTKNISEVLEFMLLDSSRLANEKYLK